MQNNKLELTWYGKDKEPVLEPRILLEDKSKSFSVEPEISLIESKVTFNNMLIHWDNLLALKSLEEKFTGAPSDFIGFVPFLLRTGKTIRVDPFFERAEDKTMGIIF